MAFFDWWILANRSGFSFKLRLMWYGSFWLSIIVNHSTTALRSTKVITTKLIFLTNSYIREHLQWLHAISLFDERRFKDSVGLVDILPRWSPWAFWLESHIGVLIIVPSFLCHHAGYCPGWAISFPSAIHFRPIIRLICTSYIVWVINCLGLKASNILSMGIL